MRSYRAQGPLPGFYHYYPGVPAVVGVRVVRVGGTSGGW